MHLHAGFLHNVLLKVRPAWSCGYLGLYNYMTQLTECSRVFVVVVVYVKHI